MSIPEGELEAAAAAMRDQMSALDAAGFDAQTRMSLTGLMVSPEDVARVAETAVQSDPPTVGKAMYEMLVRDIRVDVGGITSPVLLFGPGVGTPDQRAHVEAIYRAQVARIPEHDVVFAEGSRHFVMFDAREIFATRLAAFLGEHHGGAAKDPRR